MKRRGCDFEGETDKGHDNAGKKKRRERLRSKAFRDGGKASGARHAINEAQPKEGKRMPWNKLACAGSINTPLIAITSPRAATKVQKAVEAAVPAAARRGIAGDTPATALPRLVVTPTTRTTSAVKVTIASGAASLRRSR